MRWEGDEPLPLLRYHTANEANSPSPPKQLGTQMATGQFDTHAKVCARQTQYWSARDISHTWLQLNSLVLVVGPLVLCMSSMYAVDV